MHLMTYGTSDEGFKGLVEISEANELSQQEVLFTIPIKESVANKIESKKKFFEVIGEARIEAYIITDNRPFKIQLRANKLKQIVTAQIQQKTIVFGIDEKLNFKQTFLSRIRPLIKKRNILNLISAAIIIVGLIIKDFFLLLLLERMSNTNINFIPKEGIKNIYVGKESIEQFENTRFLILTLHSNNVMEELYIKNKTFFVNKNDL